GHDRCAEPVRLRRSWCGDLAPDQSRQSHRRSRRDGAVRVRRRERTEIRRLPGAAQGAERDRTWAGRRRDRPGPVGRQPGEARRPLTRHARSQATWIALWIGAAGAAALAWGILVERTRWTLRRVDVPVLPPGAAPVRVLYLSDLHMAPWQRDKQEWVRSLAEL